MTVVTPGGPCLTQTQIFRNEQQERYEKKQDTQKSDANAASLKTDAAHPQAKTKAPEAADTANKDQKSYGARGGGNLLDIKV